MTDAMYDEYNKYVCTVLKHETIDTHLRFPFLCSDCPIVKIATDGSWAQADHCNTLEEIIHYAFNGSLPSFS